jgi:hypothetical protein
MNSDKGMATGTKLALRKRLCKFFVYKDMVTLQQNLRASASSMDDLLEGAHAPFGQRH